jgi:hypothetical protein
MTRKGLERFRPEQQVRFPRCSNVSQKKTDRD